MSRGGNEEHPDLPENMVLDRRRLLTLAGAAGAGAALGPFAGGAQAALQGADGSGSHLWASGIHVWFDGGGPVGDAWAAVLVKGANQAAQDIGAHLEVVYSNWDPSLMVQQIRQGIAAKPDAMVVIGSPGDSAMLPLAKLANDAGIPWEVINVIAPKTIAKYNYGFVGSSFATQGLNLGKAVLQQYGSKLPHGGDVIVFGSFSSPIGDPRASALVDVLQKAGFKVYKYDQNSTLTANPQAMSPQVVAALDAHPKAKLISLSSGQFLGEAPFYFKNAGKKPGDPIAIGFDPLPSVMSAMSSGYVQMCLGQQPFVQGYLSVLSVCLTKKWLFSAISDDTGYGLITLNNYKRIVPLVNQGLVG